MNEMLAPDRPRLDWASKQAFSLMQEYSAPPIPVLDIAESNGVDVVFDPFNQYKDKVSGFCDFEAAKLYVNDNDSYERQRFTIAHELGHWIMHRALFDADPGRYTILPRFSQPDYRDPLEQEANRFAADLLVPDHLLRPVKRIPPTKLAELFGVSKQMMEIRLKRVR